MKLRCYLAHPFELLGSEEEKRLIRILKERRLEIINPFEKQTEKDRKNYTDTDNYGVIYYKKARDIWIEDLSTIKKVNLFVCYLPRGIVSIGTAAELMFALEWQKTKRNFNKHLRKKFGLGIMKRRDEPFLIQIISPIKHPLFAYALMYGNQYYESIDDFERFRQSRWKDAE